MAADFEKELIAFALADSGVAAAIGNRLFPALMQQGCPLPAAVLQKISGQRVYSLRGPSGLAHPRMQFSCYGSSFGDALAASRTVRAALDGFHGELSAGGTLVSSTYLVDERGPAIDAETLLYRADLDFEIWHSE